jgi:hypothetical protein
MGSVRKLVLAQEGRYRMTDVQERKASDDERGPDVGASSGAGRPVFCSCWC